ncbi:MAG: NUDIX hydrolase [Steroidobacteraceae bacterium]
MSPPPGAPLPEPRGPAPRAATVLLLREEDGRPEVLLTKRAAGLSFMAGLWVFPGGRVEASDESPAIAARMVATRLDSPRLRMLDLAGTPLAPDTAQGLHVAACRETFEECGVLLARPRVGPGTCAPEQVARLAAARPATITAAAFLQLLEREDLLLEADRLVYWAHWITPSVEKKRFDTRFFAVQVPAGQDASVDRSELTHHAWLGEAAIAAALGSGEMRMAPPTLATLQDVWRSCERHGSLARMLEAGRARYVPPIMPKIVPVDAGAFETVMPWDEQYASLSGEGAVAAEGYPDYLTALPSRRQYRP